MRGSENNDAIRAEGGQARCATNNAGGILGGISTGAPVLVRLAVKPTPSIAREQASVDLREMRDETLQVRGRHDPCIAPRAVPVVEAVVALSLLDAWLTHPAEESARDGQEA
jgi:chorismate synthase